MATLQQVTVISATVKQSFAFLADIERVEQWLPRVVTATRTSTVRHGASAELAVAVEAGGKRAQGTIRCTDAEAPQRLTFISTLDVGVVSTTTFDLAADGKQTRLTATLDYSFTGRGFGRMLGSLFGDSYARQDLTTALANLKTGIEAEQAARLQRRRGAAAL